jgi:hypothetical protein
MSGAGLSVGIVSNVLNRPESVPEPIRIRVAAATADLGYVRGGPSGERAAHWRRTSFAHWFFQPAVTGWYPRKAPHEPHPVALLVNPGRAFRCAAGTSLAALRPAGCPWREA